MMKKILSLSLALLLCLTMLPGEVWAAEKATASPAESSAPAAAEESLPALPEDSAPPEQAAPEASLQQFEELIFSKPNGTYPAGTQVTIQARELLPGETIRYTANGDDPTEDSPLYQRPLVVAGSAAVKAAKFGPKGRGQVVSRQYQMAPMENESQVKFQNGIRFLNSTVYTMPQSMSGEVDLLIADQGWFIPGDFSVGRIVLGPGFTKLYLESGGRLTVTDGIYVPKSARLFMYSACEAAKFPGEGQVMECGEVAASAPKDSDSAAIGTGPRTPCGRIDLECLRVIAEPGLPGGLVLGGLNSYIYHRSARVEAPTGVVPGPGGTYELGAGTLLAEGITEDSVFLSEQDGWLFLEKPLNRTLPRFTNGFLLEKGKTGNMVWENYLPSIPLLLNMSYYVSDVITIPSGYTLKMTDPSGKLEIGDQPPSSPPCSQLILAPGSRLILPEELLGRNEQDEICGLVTVQEGAEWIKPKSWPISVTGGTCDLTEAFAGHLVTLQRKELTGIEILDHWETVPAGLEIRNDQFVMPDEPVTITGVYRNDPAAPQVEDGTFLLDSAEDFVWVAERVNRGQNINSCRMTADFTLTDDMPRLGTKEHPFNGTFDGGYHTLTTNLSHPSLDDRTGGLVGCCGLELTVRNLTLTGTIDVDFYGTVGGFLGKNLYGMAEIRFENCVSDVDIIDHHSGDEHAGFVRGYNNSPWLLSFRNCAFTGSITGARGDLAGFTAAGSNQLSFANCYSAGTLTAEVGESGVDAFYHRLNSHPQTADNLYTACAVLSGTAPADSRVKEMTAEEFASGAACWYLNGEAVGTMRQTLGEDPLPLPHPDHGEVIFKDGSYINKVLPLYSITAVDCTTDVSQQHVGKMVLLTPIRQQGKIFDHWETEPAGAVIQGSSMVMPNSDVTVTAVFRDPTEEEIPIIGEIFGPEPALQWLSEKWDSNSDGYLDLEERRAIHTIDQNDDNELAGIKGLRYFPKLKRLNIYSRVNIGEPLDFTVLTELEMLWLHNSEYNDADLDLSPCTKLKMLTIGTARTVRLPENAPFESISITAPLTALDLSRSDLAPCHWELRMADVPVVGDRIPLDSLAGRPDPNRIGRVLGGTLEGGILKFDANSPVLSYWYDVDTGPNVQYVRFNLTREGHELPLASTFPDPVLREWAAGLDEDGSGGLSFKEIKGRLTLRVVPSQDETRVKDLTGLEYFFDAQELHLRDTALETLDLSPFVTLSAVRLEHNRQLTTVKIEKNINLDTVTIIDSPALRRLEMSGDTIRNLQMEHVGLTELDLRDRLNLDVLECSDLPLTSLNLSGCTRLKTLHCTKTDLQELDISGLISLTSLVCTNNRLTSLQIDPNAAANLTEVNAWENERGVFQHTPVSELPGFDPDRASIWEGGGIKNGLITFDNLSTTIGYTYDCGQGKTAQFHLNLRQDNFLDQKTGGRLLVTSRNGGTMLLADYDSDGRMTAVSSCPIPAGTVDRVVDTRPGQKAFLLSGDGSYVPLCGAATY